MKTLITSVFLFFSIILNAQMHLCNTSGKIFDLNSYDIQKDQVKYICIDNSEMSLLKKDIVYIKISKNEVITFLSGRKKVVLKEENIDTANLATLGKIDALRFYKTQNEPINTNAEYMQGYKEQLNKMKRGQTVGLILGGNIIRIILIIAYIERVIISIH
jgi:hypothetical protein